MWKILDWQLVKLTGWGNSPVGLWPAIESDAEIPQVMGAASENPKEATSRNRKLIDRTSENPKFTEIGELSAEFGGFAELVNVPAEYIWPATATSSRIAPVQSIKLAKSRAFMGILRGCKSGNGGEKQG